MILLCQLQALVELAGSQHAMDYDALRAEVAATLGALLPLAGPEIIQRLCSQARGLWSHDMLLYYVFCYMH